MNGLSSPAENAINSIVILIYWSSSTFIIFTTMPQHSTFLSHFTHFMSIFKMRISNRCIAFSTLDCLQPKNALDFFLRKNKLVYCAYNRRSIPVSM